MAGNIKGITIEFNGDTTRLDKALRNVDKSTRSIDSELKKVNNALKFNPTSIELWRQKQDLLKQKIVDTESRLKMLKQAQSQMDAKGVDKNSQEYRELQREIITTQSKLKTFKGQLQAVGNVKLRVASEQLKQIGSKATAAGHAVSGISRAAGIVTGAIGLLAYKAGEVADDLNTMSKVYGLGTKELQKYAAAAKLVDTDVTAIAKSHQKLKKNMLSAQQGSKTQAQAFKTLGINIENADGSLKDGDVVWQEVIKKLGKMSNETERDALAMQLMGKSASELNPLIEDGGKTYENLAKTMEKYDLDFVDQETLDKANKFNDQLDTMKALGALAGQTLGSKLAGVLAPALEKVVVWVGKFAEWFSKLNPHIIAVVAGISGLVAILAPALLLFGALASAAGAVAGALAGISLPIVGIVAAIGALIAAFTAAYAKSESFRKAVNQIAVTVGSLLKSAFMSAVASVKALIKDLSNTVSVVANELGPVLKMLMPVLKLIATLLIGRLKNAFNLVIGVIRVFLAVVRSAATIARSAFQAVVTVAVGAVNKIKSAFGRVKNAITQPFESAKNTISGIIQRIKGMFPISIGNILSNVKLPHFTLQWGSKDFGPLGNIKYPKGFDVSWYARGGIFNQPTLAGIGEAGPEAVVPLDKFWKKLEQMQGGDVISINVYGSDGMNVNDLAEAVEQKLIQAQKRRKLAWQ